MHKSPPFERNYPQKGDFYMENQKNDNLNMLEAIVQNTEMGKNTLDQLVPMAAWAS